MCNNKYLSVADLITSLKKLRSDSRYLATISDETIKAVLSGLADLAIQEQTKVLEENKKDLDRMDVNDPKYDRLMLTEERIAGIAGVEYTLRDLPLNISVDWKPMLNLYRSFEYDLLDFGISIHYRFKG